LTPARSSWLNNKPMAETPTPSPLLESLRREILQARARVYALARPTPLERLTLGPQGPEVFLKREDLGPIHAYKWRGAYNRMATLDAGERTRGVVTASAGNHAQGVALAARRLGVHATVFMPGTTPVTKQEAVARHGGEAVKVLLAGDSYDEAQAAARAHLEETGGVYVPAFDDIRVMAGQGTLADELVMSGEGPFDAVYLQIGGGGMAAAVAAWLKAYYPAIEVVGVEGEEQASMAAAVAAGKPVSLDYCDVFCDGTAVRRAGENTFPLCRELVDRFITVSNREVCAAMRFFWDARRAIPEPAGALGLAGILAEQERLRGRRVAGVICGANMDFGQLPVVARQAIVGGGQQSRYLQVRIPEAKGSLLRFLDAHAGDGVNIIDFQYGKTDPAWAWYTLGLAAAAEDFANLEQSLRTGGVEYRDVSGRDDLGFRLIPFRPELARQPLFLMVEFHERTGSLKRLMRAVSDFASICYFNYAYSGERVGRALIGFEFAGEAERERLLPTLDATQGAFRSYRVMEAAEMRRALGAGG